MLQYIFRYAIYDSKRAREGRYSATIACPPFFVNPAFTIRLLKCHI